MIKDESKFRRLIERWNLLVWKQNIITIPKMKKL